MILFVCSLGKMRSRTAELLCLYGGMEARCCGTDKSALAPVSDALLREASLVVCMENEHKSTLKEFQHYGSCPVVTLGIEDKFDRLDPTLIKDLIFQIGFHSQEVAEAMTRGAELLATLPGYVEKLGTKTPAVSHNAAWDIFPS